jgi:hypothetical protein
LHALSDIVPMTNARFAYDANLLQACAVDPFDPNSCCWQLFELHAAHYHETIDKDKFSDFCENVQFVYYHNSIKHRLYQLALNRFSQEPLALDKDSRRRLRDDDFVQQPPWDSRHEDNNATTTVHANTMLGIGKGSLKKLRLNDAPDTSSQHYRPQHVLRVPTETTSDKFLAPFTTNSGSSTKYKGALVRLQINKQSLLLAHHDDFSKHLNWATTNNPDGVALVHPPINQVCM